MKKYDKQPDKPNKKPQPKAARKSSPKQRETKPVELTVTSKPHILNLDNPKYHKGLTLREWQELAKKDPNLLTPTQLKQLEQADKMAAELMSRLNAQYDFTAVFRAINMLPTSRILEDISKMALATDTLRSNLILPSRQLVGLQKSLAVTGILASQSFAQAINATNITRSLFADMQLFSDRIIKALSVDIASLGMSLARFTPTEVIDVDVIDVIDRDGNVAIVSDTSRTKRINDDYQLISTAKLDLLFTELHATRSELAKVKSLIKNQLPSGLSKIAFADARFRYESSKLVLKGYEVDVQRSSKQAKFVDLFVSSVANFVKKWDIADFMLEAFGMRLDMDGNEEQFNSIIKGYITALNGKIAVATKGQMVEFFVLLDYRVYINPNYLSNL
ncbi:MAG TPA: hypothetical protein VMR18_04825 [Candidatus Saccharimonadales bacterium]|nr:hypothetical protein [Candidatus Saccharimonadales bacterium]